jgi:hypothetical protein
MAGWLAAAAAVFLLPGSVTAEAGTAAKPAFIVLKQ